MAKKQIINPYVRFDGRQQKPPASKAQGPYMNRVAAGTHGRSFTPRESVPQPALIAFQEAPNGVIKALLKGQGDVNFSRSDPANVADFEGLNQLAKANELRFEKARRVRNLDHYDFVTAYEGAVWDHVGTAAVGASTGSLTINGESVPYFPITFTRTGNSSQRYVTDTNNNSTDKEYVGSVWLRVEPADYAARGETEFRISQFDVSTNPVRDITITDQWQRFSIGPNVLNAAAPNPQTLNLRNFDVGFETRVLECCAPQSEITDGQTLKVPADYVSVGLITNGQYHGSMVDGVACFAYESGNTIDGDGIVTEAKGAAITGYRALFEPASTNVIDEAVDFTTGGGDWTTAGSCQTKVDTPESPVQGELWWRLEATTTGAGERYFYSNTFTKAAAAQDWVCSIILQADQMTWARLQVENAAETKFFRVNIDLSTGTIGTNANSTWTFTDAGVEDLKDGSYRLWIAGTTDTDTTIRLRLNLAEGDNDTFFAPGAVGDGIRIQGAQLEQSSAVTSLIITSGTAVARAADDGSGMFDFANWSQTEGSWYTDAWFGNIAPSAAQGIITTSNISIGVLSLGILSQIETWDGSNGSVTPALTATNNRYRVAMDFGTADPTKNAGYRDVDGAGSWQWGTATAYDGNYPSDVVINNFFGQVVPLRLRGLYGYKTRLGESGIEAK